MENINLLECEGKSFTAFVAGVFIEGIIHLELEAGNLYAVYLLNNIKEGVPCKEKYGFKYSIFAGFGTSRGLEICHITNLTIIDNIPIANIDSSI